MAKKTVFTTGQVAKICKVAPRTVSKWFDTHKLKGYRIPGSQDRRIPRDELVKFLKRHGMPLGELEEEGRRRLLIVGAEKSLCDRLQELLPEAENYKYGLAAFHPHAIVVDLAMSRSEALQIAHRLRGDPLPEQPLILALANEDEPIPEALVELGFDEVFKKPFDVTLLAERIKSIVERKEAIS